jgi:hypothetical protein
MLTSWSVRARFAYSVSEERTTKQRPCLTVSMTVGVKRGFESDVVKVTSPVLRGERGSDAPDLPD